MEDRVHEAQLGCELPRFIALQPPWLLGAVLGAERAGVVEKSFPSSLCHDFFPSSLASCSI